MCHVVVMWCVMLVLWSMSCICLWSESAVVLSVMPVVSVLVSVSCCDQCVLSWSLCHVGCGQCLMLWSVRLIVVSVSCRLWSMCHAGCAQCVMWVVISVSSWSVCHVCYGECVMLWPVCHVCCGLCHVVINASYTGQCVLLAVVSVSCR